MSGAAELAGAAINLQALREDAKARLVSVFESIGGAKCLVLDANLGGPLNLILTEGSRSMKEHGVKSLQELNWGDLETECKHVVYLVRPTVKAMKQIASHLKTYKHRNRSDPTHVKTFYLYFTPRRSLVCEQVLKDEQVYGMFDGRIMEYQLGFIPFDNDVLSMEMKDAFGDCLVDGDRSSLVYAARALFDLQAVFGPIPTIQSKGAMSKMVIDLMLRMRSEAASNETAATDDQNAAKMDPTSVFANMNELGAVLNPGSGLKLIPVSGNEVQTPEIDTLLLLDRTVDLVTPMCTALTYESLLDELFGIKNTYLYVDSKLLNGDDDGGDQRATEAPGKSKEPFPLNSNDSLFGEIRDLNITVLMKFLNDRAIHMKEDKQQLDRTREVSELHAYVKKLPQMQQAIKSLSHHINLTQSVSATTMDRAFRARWHAERSMLEGDSQLDYISECISKQEPLVRILRLLCLQSLTNNGIKSSSYDSVRRDIIHMYGFDVLFTLDNLEKAGLVKRRDASNAWPSIRKNYKLIVDDVDAANPQDIAYVTSGYAPLSVRLVQLAISPGWEAKVDLLKMIPGATICDVRQPGVSRPEKTDAGRQVGGDEIGTAAKAGRKVMVVFFVGGITYAEISALRFISRQPDCPYEIVVATTAIVNGSTFVKSLVKEVES